MRFQGKVYKDGKFWLAEIPMLDAMTQGYTKKEACVMVKDLIETLVNHPEFSVEVHSVKRGDPTLNHGGTCFEVSSSDTRAMISLMLRRQREKSGLSLSEVAQRLGVQSRNAYARYEQGTSVPTLEKFDQLLKAVSPDSDFVMYQTR